MTRASKTITSASEPADAVYEPKAARSKSSSKAAPAKAKAAPEKAKASVGKPKAAPVKTKSAPKAKAVAAAPVEDKARSLGKAAAKSSLKAGAKKAQKAEAETPAKNKGVAKLAGKPAGKGVGKGAGKGAGKAARKAAAGAGHGPDFICVGLQKGGTQWLYDQLQNHEDFWMPPYKEIHYFDRNFPDRNIGRAAQNYADDPKRVSEKREKRGDAPIDERGEAFYQVVLEHDAKQGDMKAYGRLFGMKGGKLTGDITPAYCSLDEKTIRKLANQFEDTRVFLMLREPVSRLWSQWRMHNAGKRRPGRAEKNFRTFKKFVKEPEVLARSFPSQIAERWKAAFGDRFRYFFLDDVVARPDDVRAEIISFIGGDASKSSNFNPDFNRKAKSRPSKRTRKMQKVMQRLFEEERVKCAKLFGGPAEKWPDLPY